MKKKLIIIGVVLIPIIFIVCWYRYYAYYPLQKIHPKDEELVGHLTSPNSQYEVKVYLSSGGATVPLEFKGVVRDKESNKSSYVERGSESKSVWKDDSTIIINGEKINVIKGSYDYRFDNKVINL